MVQKLLNGTDHVFQAYLSNEKAFKHLKANRKGVKSAFQTQKSGNQVNYQYKSGS